MMWSFQTARMVARRARSRRERDWNLGLLTFRTYFSVILRVVFMVRPRVRADQNLNTIVYDRSSVADRWLDQIVKELPAKRNEIVSVTGSYSNDRLFRIFQLRPLLPLYDRFLILFSIVLSPVSMLKWWGAAIRSWQTIVPILHAGNTVFINRLYLCDMSILASFFELPTIRKYSFNVNLYADYSTIVRKRHIFAPTASLVVQNRLQNNQADYFRSTGDLVISDVVLWSYSKIPVIKRNVNADVVFLSSAEWARDRFNNRDSVESLRTPGRPVPEKAKSFIAMISRVVCNLPDLAFAYAVHPFENELRRLYGLQIPFREDLNKIGVVVLEDHEDSLEYSNDTSIFVGLRSQSIVDQWAIGGKAIMLLTEDAQRTFDLWITSAGEYSRYMAVTISEVMTLINSMRKNEL